MSKGGRRPGAGRKPAPVNEKKVTLSVRISPESRRRLAEISKREGKSAGRMLEEYIAEVWKNLQDGEN